MTLHWHALCHCGCFAWVVRSAYFCVRWRRPLETVGRCCNLRFFMNLLYDDPYIGNIELADNYAVTFLAASDTPEEKWPKIEHWLEEEIFGTDKVVVSGFQSPFEKRVLMRLFEHQHPVIIYLSRSLYKRLPPEYEKPLTEGKLLIISYLPNRNRCSYRYSSARNTSIMKMGDEVVAVGVTPHSSIYTFFELYSRNATKPFRNL